MVVRWPDRCVGGGSERGQREGLESGPERAGRGKTHRYERIVDRGADDVGDVGLAGSLVVAHRAEEGSISRSDEVAPDAQVREAARR